jgi:hypothetical protein
VEQSIFIRDNLIFSSERMLHTDYGSKDPDAKQKSLIVILEGLDAKTNRLAVNHQS